MKNFNMDYMQENGTAKKTLSRKEYDEQLALKFAAAAQERHEEASRRAKEDFAQKSDEEKQKTMDEFADVANKPITKQIVDGYMNHVDITFFAVASTGLNTEDKNTTIKNRESGQLEGRIIPKDNPTLFKADTYTFDEKKEAYVPSDSIAIFIEANEVAVQRAIQAAKDGGYDVFANSDFVLEEYLAGNDVVPADEAKKQIATYFGKQAGMVMSYGVFHEKMLQGNNFPTPEGTIDLNRAMVEQSKYGTASLVACTNKVLGTDKENKLALSSTTEKLVADIVCLNELMSSYLKPEKFYVKEENLSKFSDKDRQALGDADEKVRIVAEERRRVRSREEMEEARKRLRSGLRDAKRSVNNEERPSRQRASAADREAQPTEVPVPAVEAPVAEELNAKEAIQEAKEAAAQSLIDAVPDINEPVAIAETVQEVPEEAKKEIPEAEAAVQEQSPAVADAADVTIPDAVQEEKEIPAEEPVKKESATEASGLEALVKVISEQNKLLAKQNEIALAQAGYEKDKVAEIQKQTLLMEQQTAHMEQLTILMDNLTKVYSMKDIENLRTDRQDTLPLEDMMMDDDENGRP